MGRTTVERVNRMNNDDDNEIVGSWVDATYRCLRSLGSEWIDVDCLNLNSCVEIFSFSRILLIFAEHLNGFPKIWENFPFIFLFHLKMYSILTRIY